MSTESKKQLLDLLKTKFSMTGYSYVADRIELLEQAIAELERLECSGCALDIDLETLKALSDEESLAMFEQCSNCSNYYENKYTKVK